MSMSTKTVVDGIEGKYKGWKVISGPFGTKFDSEKAACVRVYRDQIAAGVKARIISVHGGKEAYVLRIAKGWKTDESDKLVKHSAYIARPKKEKTP